MTPTTAGDPGPPFFRLGLAAGLVMICALVELMSHCGEWLGRSFYLVLSLLAIQGASATYSFGATLLALARRRFRLAALEAATGASMLLAIVLAIVVGFACTPRECDPW